MTIKGKISQGSLIDGLWRSLDITDCSYSNHGVTVVMVSGEMDAGNSAQLAEELDCLLTEGSRKVVIALGKVVL